jgi:hypothetical protein
LSSGTPFVIVVARGDYGKPRPAAIVRFDLFALDRNGTEDEIIIDTPRRRAMLSVAFWDEPYRDKQDPVRLEAEQKKADAILIVNGCAAILAA